ncbi:MAG: ATP-binding protein [Prochloraceae cyanobacterium]|nr:ATP-binding protein [Prochloraceae cyanobacterium]
MLIGKVFDQTSTTEFMAMLDREYDNEKLLSSYIELSLDGGEPKPNSEPIIIARITKLQKENPLLSRDQASVSASIGDIGYHMSRRFTYSWAECTVIGTLTVSGFLDMNRCSVTPNAEVHSISETSQRQLFFSDKPSHLPLGTIESFGEGDTSQVPVTLNADELVTKHFCIFGMTGSGKTNTSAKLLEELMARGHRMIIFDSHDDYINIENFSNLFCDRDSNGNKKELKCRVNDRNCDAVELAKEQLNPNASNNRPKNECVCERLIRTASVIYHNKPARQIVAEGCKKITPKLVNALSNVNPWNTLIQNRQVCSKSSFPELKYYGDDFQDFSINLLEAFQGEQFSDAQLRWLRGNINQRGVGIQYLNNLQNALNNNPPPGRGGTREAIEQKLQGLINIYNDARRTNARSIDLELFFQCIADRAKAIPQTVYRLSLTDLSNNLRKALVYGVVTYFFRSFKYRDYQATSKKGQPNAYPILFVLEEARSLIPKSSSDDIDISGKLARRAMREIGYEGRKFSLGFGLISQKPSTVDAEVVSQSNTLILHQLKSPDDQKYVRDVAESMSQEDLEMVKSLGTGRAIVTGVAIKSPVLLRVDFRYSQEGIEEPRPIENELRNTTEIRNKLGI